MKKQRLLLCLAFFILTIFIFNGCEMPSAISDNIPYDNSELRVSFIDVNQGDSTLIECGGQSMLIDAGIYSERHSVTSYLSSLGIKSLDYCVATHPHSDHIGGMSEVLYNFSVDTLVYPICYTNSSAWFNILDICDEIGVNYLNPQPGDSFTLGDATITVFSPYRSAKYENENDYSLVLKLEYENTSFLFTADAERTVEEELLSSGFDLSADVLKCGHHGSSTSSCERFIDAVNPEAAVISCGFNNDYGHPHDETLNTLRSREISIFRTDLQSTIVACSDGEEITFYTKDETNLSDAISITPTNVTTESPYIGNRNSHIFHLSDCDSINNTKEHNKVYFNTRNDAINKGYNPCKSCEP